MDFNDFSIFNVFIKNEFVYVILSINNQEINESNISIIINSNKLNFHSKYVRNGPTEPILIFIYDNPFKEYINKAEANIIYNDIFKSIKIDYIINETYLYNLTITTLFKNDYNLFPLFYEYYKKQGVEHFYMYYNGVITSEIKELFNKSDVTLIEWNFKYALHGCKYWHHAQLGQMHDALYKYGKLNSKYMIFCDLDEYLNINNNTLKNFIFQNPEIKTFGFCNIWSQTLDNKIPDTFPNEIIIGDKLAYGIRSKNIYKTDDLTTIGIHSSMCLSKNGWTPGDKSITNLNMFHFYNWSQKDRTELTDKLYNINANL